VDQLVSPHHDLDHVAAFWTTNHDSPAKAKVSDLLVIESEVIDAMGAAEQRDTFDLAHWNPLARRNGEGDHNRSGRGKKEVNAANGPLSCRGFCQLNKSAHIKEVVDIRPLQIRH